MTETSSSTARAAAIIDNPGRVTVHCWSSVRSLVDCEEERKKEKENACSVEKTKPNKKKHPKKTKQEGRVSHVAGRHDVVAKVAAEAGAGQGAAQRRRRRPFDAPAGRPRRPQAVAHHQVRVEAQRRVDGQLQSINIHQDHDCVTPHRGISSTAVLYRT